MSDFEISKRLFDCLRALVDGKAAERKKHVDSLISFLKQKAIVQYLNASSRQKENVTPQFNVATITWKIVFNRVKIYIEQECDKLQERENNNQNLSSTVRENINKDKRKCVELFRAYVKALSSSHHYDMSAAVVDHILAVLHERFTRNSFGTEYSNVLLKYVLNDPFMCLQIQATTLDSAIGIYCKIIKNPPSGWDRGSSTLALYSLLAVRSNIGPLDTSKILDFLTSMFDAIKAEKASNHHENLLKCVLLICRCIGSNDPLRLCELGESILPALLVLWKTRPSESCQELMLEFISFQMAIHHPTGVSVEDKGARAFDWSVWKNQLLNMYKVIIAEMIELCEKNRYSTSKETVLRPIFVSVAVEVCAQAFGDNIGSLDVTQASMFNDTLGGPAKKRKIEVCFRTLTDFLKSKKIIPWLQVISAFLLKYSETISVFEAQYLFDTLLEVNLSCNQLETKNWLLNCFKCFVEAFGGKDLTDVTDTEFQWQRLWDIAVKSVALMHQCQESAHKLLFIMLHHRLIVPKMDFYKLYSPGSTNRVTCASLQTVAIFIEKFSSGPTSDSRMNFESQLTEWLFSRKSDVDFSFQMLTDDDDASTFEAFAQVIALMVVKNNTCQISMTDVSSKIAQVKWISNVERELLDLSFDLPFTKSANTKESVLNNSCAGVLCDSVWKKSVNTVSDALSSVYEELIMNKQSNPAPFIRHSCLLFELILACYGCGAIKDDDLDSNSFTSSFTKFLDKAFELEMQKENIPAPTETSFVHLVKNLLKRIVSVFKEDIGSVQGHKAHNLLRTIINSIPTRILKYLLSYCLENGSEKNSVSESFDFPDSTFASSFTNKKNRYCLDDEMDVDNDCFESHLEVSDSICLMSLKSTSVSFQQQMECLDVLGEYCSLISDKMLSPAQESFPEALLITLVPFVSEKFDFKKVSDIHLVLTSLKCILRKQYLDDGTLENTVKAMKLLLNIFCSIQDVCVCILELFPLLFVHVFQSNCTNVRLKSKSHMLHLLYVLCKRELDGKGSSATSLLLTKNVFALLKLDLSISWPSLPSRNMTNGEVSNSAEHSVIYTFLQFLKNSFIPARLFVAQNINSVISSSVFDSIFECALSKVFDASESLNSTDKIGPYLHYLSHVVAHFPCLEKECIYVMFKLIKTTKTSQMLIVKVIERLAVHLSFEGSRNFVEPHLNYIFYKWIEAGYTLGDFPFFSLEVDTLGLFIEQYHKTLVPILFFFEHMDSIAVVAENLKLTNLEVLYQCLPSIQARILTDSVIDRRKANANKAKALLDSIVPATVSEKVFIVKLDEFVVCLLSLLKDDKHPHLKQCQAHDEHSVSFEVFVSTISLIMSNVDFKGSFIGLLNQKADHIQSILLSQSVMLSNAKREHEARRVLSMYQAFLKILLPELTPKLSCSSFAIKEITFSIIQFLCPDSNVERENDTILYCVEILNSLCRATVESFHEVVGELLPFVVSGLTPFANETECGQKVHSLLCFLLIESEAYLIPYISYLDPFPSIIQFNSLSSKLQEIKISRHLPKPALFIW